MRVARGTLELHGDRGVRVEHQIAGRELAGGGLRPHTASVAAGDTVNSVDLVLERPLSVTVSFAV